jgi:hypothetical protein
MGHVFFCYLSGDIADVSYVMFLTKVFTEITEGRSRGIYRVFVRSLTVDTPRQPFGGNLIQMPPAYEISLCRNSPRNKDCSTHRVLLLN